MARYVDPAPYNPDSTGSPLVNGKLFFFKSGTNTQLETFKDKANKIPNTHPVLIPANGVTPNIFFNGLAKVIKTADDLVTGEIGKQISEKDPIGDESETGDFALWDTSIGYDKNDIVEGDNEKFYLSLSDDNQANDPTLTPGDNEFWEEIRFLGVFNTKVSYAVGDIVQTTDGNLWKSLIASNLNNNPSTDDGTKWAPAFDKQWINKSAAFNVVAGKMFQIDASAGAVDAPFQAAYAAGDELIVHNESISTNLVRLTNTALTLKGKGATITTSDNLVLEPGDTAHIVMKTTTIGEFV